jgi:hypothetical protein
MFAFKLTHSLKGAWFQPLSLSSDFLVSMFAFKFNLYRYTEADQVFAETGGDARNRGGIFGFFRRKEEEPAPAPTPEPEEEVEAAPAAAEDVEVEIEA